MHNLEQISSPRMYCLKQEFTDIIMTATITFLVQHDEYQLVFKH